MKVKRTSKRTARVRTPGSSSCYFDSIVRWSVLLCLSSPCSVFVFHCLLFSSLCAFALRDCPLSSRSSIHTRVKAIVGLRWLPLSPPLASLYASLSNSVTLFLLSVFTARCPTCPLSPSLRMQFRTIAVVLVFFLLQYNRLPIPRVLIHDPRSLRCFCYRLPQLMGVATPSTSSSSLHGLHGLTVHAHYHPRALPLL